MEPSAVIRLHDPDRLAMEDAYRSLPNFGEVVVECGNNSMPRLLEELEMTGFAGIVCRPSGTGGERFVLNGYKGKKGACYETGKSAQYKGGALAALDDDHHVLFSGQAVKVCEKTATIYSLPNYERVVQCTNGDEELLLKLGTDPVPFDCNTFEEALAHLYELTWGEKTTGDIIELYYPGPFQVLVLGDGTMVRRGSVNKVPVSQAKKITRSDGLLKAGPFISTPFVSFPEIYRTAGPLSITKGTGGMKVSPPGRPPDLNCLNDISEQLRMRLISIIDGKKEYFMMTGSNKEDQFGCCPSDEVTQADELVGAGILSSTREPAPADACPLNIYAFRNEIEVHEGTLLFHPDDAFRQEILSRLNSTTVNWPRKVVTWILVAFAILSIGLALFKLVGQTGSGHNKALYQQLELTRPGTTAVVLFHYHRRCEQCLALERFTREVLRDQFPGQLASKQLQFREVIMDLPRNREVVEELGLVTSTVVIYRFRGYEADTTVVLNRSWELYDHEQEFKQMFQNELSQLMEEVR